MKHFKLSSIAKLGVAVYLAATFGIAVVSLSAKDNENTPAAVQSSKGEFIKGASLWANTCMRCHNMRDPKELDDKQWKAVVTHMRLRAGLTGQDARDILVFLQQTNDK